MLPIKTILVATDFSPMSEHAFHFAGALARDYGARLIALHVARLAAAVYAETAMFSEENDLSAAHEALYALKVPGVALEYRLVEGEPAATVVEVARETDANLIVMGTHGRGGIARVLMGSVAEDVLRNASCPVMTIKGTVPIPAEAAAFETARV
jgi:nucleotide-binding universal stress UspA family protein